MKTDLKSLNFDELTALITENGFPKFRARQVADWLRKGAASADEMRNIPSDLKNFIQNYCYISVATIEKKFVSRYDKTVKYLFAFADGECVESVVMHYKHGSTICISSQVGCRMGCKFCASTIGGKVRDLTPAELIGQVIAAQKDISADDPDARIGGIVIAVYVGDQSGLLQEFGERRLLGILHILLHARNKFVQVIKTLGLLRAHIADHLAISRAIQHLVDKFVQGDLVKARGQFANQLCKLL